MKKNAYFVGLILALASSAQAATIASWGFEVHVPTPVTDAAIIGLQPDIGSGSAVGLHLTNGTGPTSFTVPVGNGSGHSLDADHWTPGDFWQFHVSTVGFQHIQLSFDQAASGTGATNFDLQFSTDGLTFTTVLSHYQVFQNSTGIGGGGGIWNSTTYFPSYTRTVDLSSFTGLDNSTDAYFRLVANITGLPTGTSQIDNFIVSGVAVPEPASPALLGIGAILLFLNRRGRTAHR
jgi:hypothetical protein